VTMHGVNPCQRCVVPSRDSLTADVTREFQEIVRRQRQAKNPSLGPNIEVQPRLSSCSEHAHSATRSRQVHPNR
jgi:uncharacterized protein YcbX